MPRGWRLDAPLLLHHVRFRGVECRDVFAACSDRQKRRLRGFPMSRKIASEHGMGARAAEVGRALGQTVPAVLLGVAEGARLIEELCWDEEALLA